jgi:hypothetical protein
MQTKLNTLRDLIEFIEVNDLNDTEQINSICDAMLGLIFMPFKIGNETTPTAYYLKHLREYEAETPAEREKRSFVNIGQNFKITDLYIPNEKN